MKTVSKLKGAHQDLRSGKSPHTRRDHARDTEGLAARMMAQIVTPPLETGLLRKQKKINSPKNLPRRGRGCSAKAERISGRPQPGSTALVVMVLQLQNGPGVVGSEQRYDSDAKA
jgi:hypothetical protein